jgi:hypothetical protein
MDEKYITLLSMDENSITIFYPNDVLKKQKKRPRGELCTLNER